MASISVTELPPVLPRTSSSELALEFKVRMRKRTEPERSLLALNWDTTEMGTLNVIPVYRRFKSVPPTRSQSLLDTTSTSTCPSLPSLYDRTTDPLLLISKTYVEANRTRTARLIPLLPSPTSLRSQAGTLKVDSCAQRAPGIMSSIPEDALSELEIVLQGMWVFLVDAMVIISHWRILQSPTLAIAVPLLRLV